MLTEPESARLLVELNDTGADYPQNKCIHQLFEEQVEKTPDAVALVFEDRHLTYRELNAKANQLARHLQNLGVGPEVLVGLCVERSLEMVVAMLGILKAGGAYVPLDPAYPPERLAFMKEDAALSIVVTQEKSLGQARIAAVPPEKALLPEPRAKERTSGLTSPSLKLVSLDNDWEKISQQSRENPESKVNSENLAYVIYTSGSTGKPKGVMMQHNALVNLISWQLQQTTVSKNAKTLQFSPISFDVSFQEIFTTWCGGGTLVLISEKVRRDPVVLLHLLADKEVERLFLPFIALQQLAEVSETFQLLPGSLREVITAGEQLQVTKAIASFFAKLPNCTLHNQYGPSETHVVTAFTLKGAPSEWPTLPPIGRPIANTEVYLLDESHQPVPIGVAGELYVGGVCLARGYINRPELTDERFVPSPFNPKLSTRLYKTGDLATYLRDGNIQFFGRTDSQVKIRGYRIEIGEIEVVLSEHPEVKQAAVVAREDIPGDKRLVAYVVPGSEGTAAPQFDGSIEKEQVRQWEKIWDEAYGKPGDDWESGFHIGGWYDSYTGKTLPTEQVREWIDLTVERILSQQPLRVLEIGCGTGLLLFQVAPHCQYYCGTDIAAEGLNYIENQIKDSALGSLVSLRHSGAEELEGMDAESFDTAVINGVVQFFPNMDYLVRVIEGVVQLVQPGGSVFIGDVESFTLLEAFATSVQLYRASASLDAAALRDRIQKQIAETKKLNIAPEFFIALKERLPQISHVEIQLKRGRYQNELTRFRYDVVLHLGKKVSTPTTPPIYLNWQQDNLTVAAVCQHLLETSPEILAVTGVPNPRVWADLRAMELLASSNCPETVGEVRQQISPEREKTIEPEDWWQLQSEVGYRINITWSGRGDRYDVIFVRGDTNIIADSTIVFPQKNALKSWSAYANKPYTGGQPSQLIPQLRGFLAEKLPDYMMPSAFVVLDELPLTPSGKVDRRALPAPDKSRPLLEVELVAPRTPTEEILAGIWAEVLSLDKVGALDNFFMLGGDSIQATQLISRVRDTFGIELSLHRLFESPTVAEFGKIVDGTSRKKLAPIQPVPRDGDLPLSFAEQRLWFLDRLQEGSVTYNEQEGLRLSGSLEVEALQAAVQEIVRRHESLRTNYRAVDGSPVRVIRPELELKMPVVDLQHLPPEEQVKEVQGLGDRETRQPFDLASDPLLRVTLLQLAGDDYVLLLTMHHIITDGWSTGVFCHELEALYGAYVLGKPSPLPSLPIQYADFASWQRQPTTAKMLSPQLAYWKQQLAGAPPLLELPTDYTRPTVQTPRGGKEFFELGVELTEKLKRLSREEGATLFMTLFAAFSTLLFRYSSQEDIVAGTPIANRNRSEIEGLIGFFVNTLVLRTRLEGNPKFTELLQQVRQTALDAYAHQDVPFEQLVEALQPERSLSHSPIFQVMFTLQNAPITPLELPGVSFKWLPMETAKAKFDLFLSMEETEAGLIGYWEYNRDLFEPATIRRAIAHFQILLEGIVANPQTPVSELPLLTEAERHQLLVEWNDTAVVSVLSPHEAKAQESDYPQDKCIHQLFEEQVERTPDAVAVVFENERLTYRELNAKANQLARYLQSLGVGPEVLVGICVERSIEMIIGVLGILKAGGAYVPIEPDYPSDRLAYILEDSKARVLLTQENLVPRFSEDKTHVVCLEKNWDTFSGEGNIQNCQVNSANLAYVIYTSGSTGKPKAVTIEHQAALNLSVGLQQAIYATQSQRQRRVSVNAPLVFDSSVKQLLRLLHGDTLYILPKTIRSNGKALLSYLQKQQIDVFDCTPSQLTLIIEKWFDREETLPEIVLVGGEAIDELTWQALAKAKQTHFYNVYGPTECTADTTVASCYQNGVKPVIGRAIANTQIYILDNHLQPVPIGVPGELHVGGAGLARGYLNRPELTEQKFIPNPFSNEPGSRLYKTGDLARYLPDGNIEFIGRIDNQVKIRGFRIELGEIEATLSQHPEVREAVVIVREDSPGDKRIVAYIVPKAEEVASSELRGFLKTKLPDYMVPSAFVFLDAIPLTANGKSDRAASLKENRRALPKPDADLEVRAIAPRTTTELQLSQIWSEVLNIPTIGVRDNFFDLGGHSLLAVRLMARIEQQLGTHLPLATLFSEPTIENQASLLSAATDAQPISPLVAIQKTGEKPPFFCVHPVGGNVLCYSALARNLGNNRPFYGLQSPGVDGKTQLLTSIEEMAASYVKALQTVRPMGPYYLGGWSMGGVVAWEMARQLQAVGQEVALVALIDSYAPSVISELEEIDEIALTNSLAADLGAMFGTELPISANDIQQLQPKEQMQDILVAAKRLNLLPPEVGIEQMHRLFRVFKANRIALANYQPQPYSGLVVLFSASSSEEDRGWSSLATGDMETHVIPGDHYGMMLQPQVRVLAQKLEACLNRGQERLG